MVTGVQQVEFQVGAKAARLIGRENIADVDGALIELIKNAYDADASCVYVNFYIPFPDIPNKVRFSYFAEHLSEEELEFIHECYEEVRGECRKKSKLTEEEQNKLKEILFSHDRILVADNGCGMSLDIVKSAWMYIGTSNKEYHIMSDKGRVKTGAKGIGRFALDKLSVKSVMYTQADLDGEIIKWSMDWDQFASARLISDVKAEIDFCHEEYQEIVKKTVGRQFSDLTGHDWSSGTMIVLTPIRESWSERLFQKVNNNLKSINPIGSADKFEVIINNSFYPEYNFKTEEVAIDKEDYDYRIKADYDGKDSLNIRLLRNEADLSKKSVTVEKYGTSRKISAEDFWRREKFCKKGYRKEDYDKEICLKKNVEDILADGLEKIQKVGPFTAELYFLRNANNEAAIMKKVAVRKRKKLLSQFSGIKLYRDNFKVRPYGDEGAMYDWIGMSTRVQKSPAAVSHPNGSWRVQPYQMIGLVKIGRETNPYLEDMANREGITLTDTYYVFVNLLQECIKEFEFDRQYIYREYKKWMDGIEAEMADYTMRIQKEAVRRVENYKADAVRNTDRPETAAENDGEDSHKEKDQDRNFSEDEMFHTVYKLMKDSEKELNSKQMIQILSSSGILLNTFFHEFQAINTQFHVQASQIRSRVSYILKGREYEGIPAYNPYKRIDNLEKNDRITAAFLDVIMDGLRKENLKAKKNSLKKMITSIMLKWKPLLEEKHICLNLAAAEDIEDDLSIALVDMYIILNNFILNSAWFLEQEHNTGREISFLLKSDNDRLYLYMENNGPCLAEKYQDNSDKIFEMGETSKGEKGTGLGLWAVKETVERNGGTVSVMEKQKGFGLEIVWKNREGGSDVSDRYH